MGNEVSTDNSSPQNPIPNELELKWDQLKVLTQPQPKPREGHVSGIFGGKLFVFGGGSGPEQLNDFYCLDPTNTSWSQVTNEGSPIQRTGATACVVNNQLIIIGGLNTESGSWLTDVFSFDFTTSKWSELQVTGVGPSPRDKLGCCAIGNKIYVFGGFGPQSPPEEVEEEEEDDEEMDVEGATFGWFNDLHVLDLDAKSWSLITATGTIPTPRAAFGNLCPVGSKIYLIGGRDTTQRTNDVYMFDTETNAWTLPAVHGAKPSPRSFHSCTVIGNDRIAVFGGLSKTNVHLGDLHIFDTRVNAWIQPKKVEGIVPPRGFHTANYESNRLVIFGGSADFDAEVQENKTYFNDIHVIDLTAVVNASAPTV